MRHDFINHLNDDELILLKRHGDEYASCHLFKKYRMYSKKISAITYYKNRHYLSLKKEDYQSLFENCFINSLKNYIPGQNLFKAYWEKILANELNKVFAKLNKNNKLSSIQLDCNINKDSDTRYSEVVGSNDYHIKNNVEKDDICQHLLESNQSRLTDEERLVFIAFMFNKSIKSIAKKLECDAKHVRYIYAKAKTKLECLKNNL